jgi:hypothetical protein
MSVLADLDTPNPSGPSVGVRIWGDLDGTSHQTIGPTCNFLLGHLLTAPTHLKSPSFLSQASSMSSSEPIMSGPPSALDAVQISTMPPADRSIGRNVHIYDANDLDTVLGGLILSTGVTNANLYSMVDILFIFENTFILRHEDHTQIERDGAALRPGKYYIVSARQLFPQLMVKWLNSA